MQTYFVLMGYTLTGKRPTTLHSDFYLASEVDPLRARLVEAETALLNAMMGNANSVAAYLLKYPDPYSAN